MRAGTAYEKVAPVYQHVPGMSCSQCCLFQGQTQSGIVEFIDVFLLEIAAFTRAVSNIFKFSPTSLCKKP